MDITGYGMRHYGLWTSLSEITVRPSCTGSARITAARAPNWHCLIPESG